MFSLGRNITAANDPLIRIDVQRLAEFILGKYGNLQGQIQQLRAVHSLDMKRYSNLKLSLPYIVCGLFNPPYRRIINFSRTEYFILDLDHLNDKELGAESLKSSLASDKRIQMLFTSPSGDGLKLVFRLMSPCHDSTQYSLFYKAFARSFATQHGIEQVTDSRTSDVSRACFLSYDPELYFLADSEPVDISAYINFGDLHQVRTLSEELKKTEKQELAKSPKSEDHLPDDLLKEIRLRLNPSIKTREERVIFTPQEIGQVMADVEAALNKEGLAILAAENISYGRKIRVGVESFWAEINLFYGKKGYSVVKTPKRGSNDELADIASKIVCSVVIFQG